ncbi:MAG: hypothetical protein NT091_02425, partial [Candidatus Falkowbacteria bacterium]|nr:hypothetical protein [Candidatus Falkowbacteria bacterium]
MKTILYFITQNEFGGAQKYIFELTKGLKANYQIGVVYGGKDTDSEFKQKLTELGVSIYCITSLKRSISP